MVLVLLVRPQTLVKGTIKAALSFTNGVD